MSSGRAKQNTPPAPFTRLLNWSLPTALKEPVIGDLWEEYFQRLQSANAMNADYWFAKQALKTSVKFMFKTQVGVIGAVDLSYLATLVAIFRSSKTGGERFSEPK